MNFDEISLQMTREMNSNKRLNMNAEVMGNRQSLLNKIKLKSPGSLPNLKRPSHGSRYCNSTIITNIKNSHLNIFLSN